MGPGPGWSWPVNGLCPVYTSTVTLSPLSLSLILKRGEASDRSSLSIGRSLLPIETIREDHRHRSLAKAIMWYAGAFSPPSEDNQEAHWLSRRHRPNHQPGLFSWITVLASEEILLDLSPRLVLFLKFDGRCGDGEWSCVEVHQVRHCGGRGRWQDLYAHLLYQQQVPHCMVISSLP